MGFLNFRCEICGLTGGVSDMYEREIVGKRISVCQDCDIYLDRR